MTTRRAMRTIVSTASFTLLSCAAATGGSATRQETPAMSAPSASRPAPPAVAPVEAAGVRYLEDRTDERDGDQAGGYLAAVDVATGATLWRLKVYDVPDHRAAGVHGNSRHFSALAIAEGGAALIVDNEAGGRYRVDLAARSVTQIGGPPEQAPLAAAAPAKPKPDAD